MPLHKQRARARVLVVDDDEDIVETIGCLLDDEGYDVSKAQDGREALHLLRSGLTPPPCIILLDLNMPVMNGIEFLAEQIRDPALAELPVALFTADDRSVSVARHLNVATVVKKPVALELLLALVRRHAESARAR
jgi:CheY-like chemotaxis protein